MLSNHCSAIFINVLNLSSLSFAFDISSIIPSWLNFTSAACSGEFDHTKLSRVVTFSEPKHMHLAAIQYRKWVSGDDTVDELYEYENFRVLKN